MSDSKGFEVRPDGTIIAPTLEDAIQLSKRLRDRTVVSIATEATKVTFAEEYVPTILSALAKAGPNGVQSRVLAQKIGLSDSRGLAGVIARVRNEITSKINGDDVTKYIWRQKLPGQPAVWFVDRGRLMEAGML